MDRNYDVKTFFQNTLILRRPKISNFAVIIKIATTLNTMFKTFEY